MSALAYILIAVGLALVWLWLTYNKLVAGRNRTREAWADIDVQLKRRYDLIPNLVETVKGYASHEAGLLENVTKARSQAMGATTPAEHSQAENVLSQTLKSLFAVAESYPDLKANQNFAKLQDELSDTENKIQAARRFYNGNVRDFNTSLQVFPTNLVAGWFSFVSQDFFELDEKDAAAREPVAVKF